MGMKAVSLASRRGMGNPLGNRSWSGLGSDFCPTISLTLGEILA